MRRILALAAAALVAPALAMAAPATAHAAPGAAKPVPSNPVDALRQQFGKKTGVHMDTTVDMRLGGDDLLKFRQVGSLRFGKSGVDAYDLKRIVDLGKGKDTLHLIALNGKAYMQSPLYDEMLPADKKWVRTPGSKAPSTNDTIDILRPAVLKTVLASTKVKRAGGTVGGARTTLYTGAVKVGELSKVSTEIEAMAEVFKLKKNVTLPWKLWIGADQLPRRFQSTFPMGKVPHAGRLTVDADSRYTAWGAKVVITAPPADQVIDEKDLTTDLPETTPDFTKVVPSLTAGRH
ncbi:hypothetical protein [Sphaerisporangium fuscum]|uniref:hypothetical protein n=1 Tax=Sphaerisporangium fuscum TaxID=2835868 RepID=UPI001BDCEBA2|nr:hypothetical protein [Sphaerisporangium fuscum]